MILQDGCKQRKEYLPPNNFPFFQANDYCLSSLIYEGCGLRDDREAETSAVRCNGQERIFMHVKSVVWLPRSIISAHKCSLKLSKFHPSLKGMLKEFFIASCKLGLINSGGLTQTSQHVILIPKLIANLLFQFLGIKLAMFTQVRG